MDAQHIFMGILSELFIKLIHKLHLLNSIKIFYDTGTSSTCIHFKTWGKQVTQVNVFSSKYYSFIDLKDINVNKSSHQLVILIHLFHSYTTQLQSTKAKCSHTNKIHLKFSLCAREKKNAYKKICIDHCGVCIKVNNTEK